MNAHPIIQAAHVLPDDHARGVARQVQMLQELTAELGTMEPGSAEAKGKLFAAHTIASALFAEARCHPNGANVADWYLSTLSALNGLARRHHLEEFSPPWKKV